MSNPEDMIRRGDARDVLIASDSVMDAMKHIAALPAVQPQVRELEAYYAKQIDWSRQTFGPALRTGGIIDHIKKELTEIAAQPHDLSEWVDVMILAMDGFWRHGGKASDLMPALLAKQTKNMARIWPDWRTRSEGQAIEHDRSGEAHALTPTPVGDSTGADTGINERDHDDVCSTVGKMGCAWCICETPHVSKTPKPEYDAVTLADAMALTEVRALVDRLQEAAEGMIKGKAVQFHPNYCEEANGAKVTEWDSSHDMSVIRPDGTRYRIGSFRHAADAEFYQTVRTLLPALLAALRQIGGAA